MTLRIATLNIRHGGNKSADALAARLLGYDADLLVSLLLASLAGVTPSTRQSGKVKNTTFRWAADKHLRDAVCDFASDSRHVSPWAADLYRRARARGHHHPHAVRILARAWVYVIWRCWQNHQPYDPGQHRALQQLLDQSATAA